MKLNRQKYPLKFSVILTAILLCVFFANGNAAVQDGLIAYWPLDENSGDSAVDVVNAHNGTLINGMTWVSGKLGSAVDTNNTGYIVIPEDAQLRPSSGVSVQAWVNVDTFALWEGIAGNFQDNGSNESGYCLYVTASGIGWYVSVNGTFASASASCAAGQWVHFVGIFDFVSLKED